ncbi:MAG: hypothetical protein OEM91_15235 [Hyphomicrobiales bacterium]|nr:hypothetical protein [Hyphomicrobiales bacterium]
MALINYISRTTSRFLHDEDGVVTIDWVLVVAGVVSMSMAVMISIGDGAQEFSEKMDTELSNRPVTTTY